MSHGKRVEPVGLPLYKVGMSLPDPFVPNYDEAAVPAYQLPELLRMEDGREVVDLEAWRQKRRPELLKLFRENVYGQQPPSLAFEVERVESGLAFGGRAEREQVRLWFGGEGQHKASIDLLIYRPADAQGPVPVFLGLNFRGNATTTLDPAVCETSSWRVENLERGGQASRWAFEEAIAAGYAVATFYFGDVAPDHAERWRDGLPQVAFPDATGVPGAEEPGAVAWWAWGLSRALDYLSSREVYDARRVAVFGHSRQGKAALWAAAQDERFALAISNNSGCTGAALARRCVGETIAVITQAFPHWFCGNYGRFAQREAVLPVDQHQLMALIAPRPLYVASATEDLWADPRGEFLAAVAAAPVYEWMGCPAGLDGGFPPAGVSVGGGRIGYHLREGKHAITGWDWEQFLRFAGRVF